MTGLVLPSYPTAWFLRSHRLRTGAAEIGAALTTLSTRSYEIVRNTGIKSDERQFVLRRSTRKSLVRRVNRGFQPRLACRQNL